MRWIVYLALIAGTMLAPVERADVAKLQPVELISLQRRGEGLLIRTDTGDAGTGKSLTMAIMDLKKTTPGIVYLDTAQYLLVYPGCEPEAEQMKAHLKDRVRICAVTQEMELTGAAEFLNIHPPTGCLGDWNAGEETDELRLDNGRFWLIKNNKEKGEKGVDKTNGT